MLSNYGIPLGVDLRGGKCSMQKFRHEAEKEKIRKEALETHARLSELFKKDRLAFERERKRIIDELINSVEDEAQRSRLIAFQKSWDKKMRGAGSNHNRFVLAQTFFWDHFYEKWHPSIQKLNALLNPKLSEKL